MRIYIDEAGSFVPSSIPASSFSLVLALVIPTLREDELFFEFLRLRDRWSSKEIEMKGSRLDEKQAAEVVNLLARFDVLMNFAAVDMLTHGKEVVDSFKARQADAITAHVTRDHYPDLVQHLVLIERSIRAMSNQLFVQAELTIGLILKVVQNAILYYVQREPKELGEIAWTIDRKDRTITEMEETWTTLILPAAEHHFVNKPLISLIGADYSHFENRYEVELATNKDMADHVEWVRETFGDRGLPRSGRVIDAKLLLTEQQKFGDSRDSLGLQLADTLANILRRALNKRLQEPGWRDLGKLVVHDPQPGWFLQLGRDMDRRPVPDDVLPVWEALTSQSKSMVYGKFIPGPEPSTQAAT
jgi:hypothetical protein